MLHQPRRWLPGLLPLALLAGGSLWWKQGAIEADLAGRATNAIAATSTVDGKPWASVAVRGRDAVITGTAPALEAAAAAETISEGQFGVRRADAANDFLPAANPFGWSARRQDQTIILSGQVAPDGSRARLVEAARKAVSGAEVSDLMTLARDIPATATRAAELGLEQLARVTSGSATLSGTAFRFTGTAGDAATKALIEQALSGLPPGITSGGVNVSVPSPAAPQAPPPQAILPPEADWTATKSADGAIRLQGSIGSAEARDRILAAARSSTTGPVTDGMTIIAGLPANLEAKALSALEQLKGLSSGTAKIAGTVYSFTGVAADPQAFDRLAAAVRGANDGFTMGDLIVAPPVVSPFSWSARRMPDSLTLQGFAPSEAAKAAVLALARRLAGSAGVVDEMRLAGGFPDGVDFAALTQAALTQLFRLTEGSAQLTGSRLTLAGRAPDAAAAMEVRQALAALGPRVVAITDLALPPAEIPPPPPAPPLSDDLAPPPAARLETLAPAVQQLPLPVVPPPPPSVEAMAPPVQQLALPAVPPALPPAVATSGASGSGTAAAAAATAPAGATAGQAPASTASAASAAGSGGSAETAASPTLAQGAPAAMPPQPAPAPVWLPPPDCGAIVQTALEGDRILFDYWKAEQRAEHGPVLDRLAAAIKRCGEGVRIEVAGHADSHNWTGQNQKLSEDRAAVMRDELVRRGVEAGTLVVVGHAANRPVASNETEEGRALNRRVEFHVRPRP
jgi:outer membrane protein OmpA-like peptidoglycan-associated protein